LHQNTDVYKGDAGFGGVSDSICAWEHSQAGPGGTLSNAEGGDSKAESAAQTPRCRNEYLLLDQEVRSFAENNSLSYLGEKAFIWSQSIDCYLFQTNYQDLPFKRNT